MSAVERFDRVLVALTRAAAIAAFFLCVAALMLDYLLWAFVFLMWGLLLWPLYIFGRDLLVFHTTPASQQTSPHLQQEAEGDR